MIVANSLMRRRDDLDLETFRKHWLDPHGPLTAKLPRCRRYVQNHVLDAPGTNALARALRIDGIPQLAFDTPEDRLAAHNSPELKACDQDSPSFIGAVSRVMTNVDGPIDFEGPRGAIKQMLLFLAPRGDGASSGDARLRPEAVADRLHGVRRLVRHAVLEQTRAPGSQVPNLDIPVEGLC
ncbi:MAG: EthD family reductase, partial [Proteobacteria bacterium]|nr:EthD family reductase [Pseudomonadota bacterium]